uniref:Uncharacterized protein n=1 Tax=Lepeophtheirus salmonis TaxID=72036 RepID=A0A0K2V935_LEPSM
MAQKLLFVKEYSMFNH